MKRAWTQFACILCCCLVYSFPGLAALPKNNPVPGGVLVIDLGKKSEPRPIIRFGDRPVYIARGETHWTAIVGLPQDILPGKYILTFKDAINRKTKKTFRVQSLPADLRQRIVVLPKNLDLLEFHPHEPSTLDILWNERDSQEHAEPPGYEYRQIISSGSYIPYGWIVSSRSPDILIEHSWITYITEPDTLVYSPSAALVEQTFLSANSGMTVILNHGNGMKSVISNLDSTRLKPGETIDPGSVIGTVNHIEALSIGRVDWLVALNGYGINPLQFTASP